MSLDVEEPIGIIRKLHKAVCPQWEEAWIPAGNAGRSRHEEKEIDVATRSMGVVPRDSASRLSAEIPHDEWRTSGHFLFDDRCCTLDRPHESR